MRGLSLTNDNSALSDYLRGLYQFKSLPLEEEAKLAKMIQAGDAAALDKLVKHNLRFVVYIIKSTPQWSSGKVPIEDLIAAGNEGLLKAARRWVPRAGVGFSAFARKFIQLGVRRAIDNEWSLIRIPVNVAEEIRRMRYHESALLKELKRTPTAAEVADRLGVHEKRVTELQSIQAQEPMPLDTNNQGKSQEEIEE